MFGIYLGLVFLFLTGLAGFAKIPGDQKFKSLLASVGNLIQKKDKKQTARAFVLLAAFSFSLWEAVLWVLWDQANDMPWKIAGAIFWFVCFAGITGHFSKNSQKKPSDRQFFIFLWISWSMAIMAPFSGIIFMPWIWFRFRE